MSLLKNLSNLAIKGAVYCIKYGPSKKEGGHDHRSNTGLDRTSRQREGDKKRSK